MGEVADEQPESGSESDPEWCPAAEPGPADETAAELRVPEDYASLEAAYEAARPGDRIVLGAGEHQAGRIKMEKSIFIRGAGVLIQGNHLESMLTVPGLLIRGAGVSIELEAVRLQGGGVWLYHGARLSVTDCQLSVPLVVGAAFRGQRDNTASNCAPRIDDSSTALLLSRSEIHCTGATSCAVYVRNGAKAELDQCSVAGTFDRALDAEDPGTCAKVNDCVFESLIEARDGTGFGQWSSAVAMAAAKEASLHAVGCTVYRFGSAAFSGCKSASVDVERCKCEGNYRGLWAWSQTKVHIEDIECDSGRRLQLDSSVELIDSTAKKEVHVPGDFNTLEDACHGAPEHCRVVLATGMYTAIGRRLVLRRPVELAAANGAVVQINKSELVITGVGAQGFELTDIQFSNCPGSAVTVTDGASVKLQSCRIVAPAASGVVSVGPGASAVLKDCEVAASGSHAVLCRSGGSVLAMGCEFERTSRSSVKAMGLSSRISLQWCMIRASGDNGIVVDNAASVTVRGCIIENARADGFRVNGEGSTGVLLESSISQCGGHGVFGWRGAAFTSLSSTITGSEFGDVEILEGCLLNGVPFQPPVQLPPVQPRVPAHRRNSEQRPNHGTLDWNFSDADPASTVQGPHYQASTAYTPAPKAAPLTVETPTSSSRAGLPSSPSRSPNVVPPITSPTFPVNVHHPRTAAVEVQVGMANEFVGRYDLDDLEAQQRARAAWKDKNMWNADSHSDWRKLSLLSGWMPPVGYRSVLQRDLDDHKRAIVGRTAAQNTKDRVHTNKYFPDIGVMK